MKIEGIFMVYIFIVICGNRNPDRHSILERIASSLAGIKFIVDNFMIVIFVSILDLAKFSTTREKLHCNSLCKPCFKINHKNLSQS